jgi:hypothetical protein
MNFQWFVLSLFAVQPHLLPRGKAGSGIDGLSAAARRNRRKGWMVADCWGTGAMPFSLAKNIFALYVSVIRRLSQALDHLALSQGC